MTLVWRYAVHRIYLFLPVYNRFVRCKSSEELRETDRRQNCGVDLKLCLLSLKERRGK